MAYIGKQPVVGNFVKLDAIVTSATATYNLLNGGTAYFPQTANNCIVSLNGVIQSPTSAYTISGSTIVFDSALTSADSIDFILVLGDVLAIGTPSDATVGFAKVTSNLITGATAETSIAGGDSVLIYDDSASALRKMTRTNFVSGIGGTNTPNFAATVGANHNISNLTTTAVQFNTEVFDTNSSFDTSTYRFTVPSGSAGKYLISVSVRFQAFTSNRKEINLYKNGSNFYSFENAGTGGGLYDTVNGSIIMDLAVADYIQMFAYQDSGGTNAIRTDSFFQAFKLIE